jgi:hypothetical protein
VTLEQVAHIRDYAHAEEHNRLAALSSKSSRSLGKFRDALTRDRAGMKDSLSRQLIVESTLAQAVDAAPENRALLRTQLERRCSLANGRSGRLEAAHRPTDRSLPEQA